MESILFNLSLVILGGYLGSFASILIYRLPRENESLNIFYVPSYCPKCKTRLGFLQLIPYIGYLINAGNCGTCKKKISSLYLIHEIIFASLILYIVHMLGGNLLINIYVITLLLIMYVQSLMDFETLMLSKSLSLLLVLLGLTLNISQEFFTIPIDALLGFIFGYGILLSINLLHKMIKGIDGIGSDDFLLLAGIGATFGASAIGPILLVGASITFILYTTKKDKNKDLSLGFGLALSGILYCLLSISIN